jgi:hydroxymethylpyrimidine pyrophosphatase-like HAD family hydrolase
MKDVIACGDNYNDISMVSMAGLGVAMANAEEELKAVADYVTINDCDNDGLAEVVEKFIL